MISFWVKSILINKKAVTYDKINCFLRLPYNIHRPFSTYIHIKLKKTNNFTISKILVAKLFGKIWYIYQIRHTRKQRYLIGLYFTVPFWKWNSLKVLDLAHTLVNFWYTEDYGRGGGGWSICSYICKKKFLQPQNEKQQNCLSLESKLCKICFTEQIINKCDIYMNNLFD